MEQKKRNLFVCVYKMYFDAGPDELGQLVEIASAAAGKQQRRGRSRLGSKKLLLDASYWQHLKTLNVRGAPFLLYARISHLGSQCDFARHSDIRPHGPIGGERKQRCYHRHTC